MDWIGRCVIMAIFVLSMKVCMKSWYERLKVGPFSVKIFEALVPVAGLALGLTGYLRDEHGTNSMVEIVKKECGGNLFRWKH